MALPASGPISMSQVNVEVGSGSVANVSLNQSNVRLLFEKSSGLIDMGSGRGKIFPFTFNQTIAANTSNYNLKAAAIAAGWDQASKLYATIIVNSGVTVSSSSTGTPAFDTGDTFPAGSTININNAGNIYGLGGAGGAGGVNSGNGAAGLTGGTALKSQFATTLDNTGTIAGGSGGNGGSAATRTGGTSGTTGPQCTGGIGCIKPACNNGFCNSDTGASGSVGGSGGTAGLGGGTGASASFGTAQSCSTTSGCTGGPGCNGTASCPRGLPGAGGPAGACIIGNGNISYTATGTRLGPIT